MFMTNTQWITRKRRNKSFIYYRNGELLRDADKLKYIQSLTIPPAWSEVKIAVNERADLRATGYDDAGRLQYIYHPNFRARQDDAKFEKILQFGQALPHLRKMVDTHLREPGYHKEKILACIIQLMDETYIRVGNDQYAKANHSYGLTTLRKKHVRLKGESITFDFMGKSKQRRLVRIRNKQISRIVRKLADLPGYELFKYYDENQQLQDVKSTDVNQYIKTYMGQEFSAKDFRTWGGTLLAAAELGKCKWNPDKSKRSKTVVKCVRKVAKQLGNTPAIARKSYIDPRIIESYLTEDNLSKLYKTVKSVKKSRYFSDDEQYVLDVLKSIAIKA